MFDFIRKPLIWQAWDNAYNKEIGATGSFCLKSMQDLAVYSYLRGSENLTIAEIGGGDSRILQTLAKRNRCFNIEKFEGDGGGPSEEVKIAGVENIKAFLGDNDPQLKSDFFDVVFSISVVEHVPDLKSFFDDGVRILKSGGLWLHAVDMYVEDEPNGHAIRKFENIRNWATAPSVSPIGPVYDGPPAFSCDIASNPDNTMHRWGRLSPRLADLRKKAQCVSLLVGARKI
ncbi:class I SAM-dependent methyltransferase [Hyphococcus sp.]|uniref:class I SAM-dependent methyltransferase n=1 Tax=Hyphococcus sp. TaxID=2038636 RepID=UPI0035C7613B